MIVLLRIAAWLSIPAICAATLGPVGLRPASAAPVDLERFAAFLFVGGLFGMAYPRRNLSLVLFVVLIAPFWKELSISLPTGTASSVTSPSRRWEAWRVCLQAAMAGGAPVRTSKAFRSRDSDCAACDRRPLLSRQSPVPRMTTSGVIMRMRRSVPKDIILA